MRAYLWDGEGTIGGVPWYVIHITSLVFHF